MLPTFYTIHIYMHTKIDYVELHIKLLKAENFVSCQESLSKGKAGKQTNEH